MWAAVGSRGRSTGGLARGSAAGAVFGAAVGEAAGSSVGILAPLSPHFHLIDSYTIVTNPLLPQHTLAT